MKREPEQVSTEIHLPDRTEGLPTTDDRTPERPDPEHRAAIAAGREQIRRGEIASAEEVEAAFRRFDP